MQNTAPEIEKDCNSAFANVELNKLLCKRLFEEIVHVRDQRENLKIMRGIVDISHGRSYGADDKLDVVYQNTPYLLDRGTYKDWKIAKKMIARIWDYGKMDWLRTSVTVKTQSLTQSFFLPKVECEALKKAYDTIFSDSKNFSTLTDGIAPEEMVEAKRDAYLEITPEQAFTRSIIDKKLHAWEKKKLVGLLQLLTRELKGKHI